MTQSESSKYRTPYAPYGGFTNGYEGDLRAHLMAGRPHVAERQGADVVPSGSGLRLPLHPQSQPLPPRPPQPPRMPQSHQQQQSQHQAVPALQAPKPKPPPATKIFKVGLPAAFHLSLLSTKSAVQVPAKISPVPLPPHVVAAMAKPSQKNPCSTASLNATVTANPAACGPRQLAAEKANLVPPGPCQMKSETSPHMASTGAEPQSLGTQNPDSQVLLTRLNPQPMQEFADVPGSESMQFMDRMMQNLRRASMNGGGSN